MSDQPLVSRSAWKAMVSRCTSPTHHKWERYGGRGITICREWATNYAAFARDMGPRPSPTHTVDRIDPDGNYEPDNCRWATVLEQRHNRSMSSIKTDWEHGRAGYTNHGCRCEVCATAERAYQRSLRGLPADANPERPCAHCGKTFKPAIQKARPLKYCSLDCAVEVKRVQRRKRIEAERQPAA